MMKDRQLESATHLAAQSSSPESFHEAYGAEAYPALAPPPGRARSNCWNRRRTDAGHGGVGKVGTAVGLRDGAGVLGLRDGTDVLGLLDGDGVGWLVGWADGLVDGLRVGPALGAFVVGVPVGAGVGSALVGMLVVGAKVLGAAVGAEVGATVGPGSGYRNVHPEQVDAHIDPDIAADVAQSPRRQADTHWSTSIASRTRTKCGSCVRFMQRL